MFDPASRYHPLATVTRTEPDGRVLTYKRRRFLPRGRAMPVLTEVVTTEGERLDQIAARTLGDPEQYWRICDANDAMNPADLLRPAGRRVRVPVPQA